MDGVKIVDLEQLAPRRWEYESYIRRSAITHITTATNTLQSLMKLLSKFIYESFLNNSEYVLYYVSF